MKNNTLKLMIIAAISFTAVLLFVKMTEIENTDAPALVKTRMPGIENTDEVPV